MFKTVYREIKKIIDKQRTPAIQVNANDFVVNDKNGKAVTVSCGAIVSPEKFRRKRTFEMDYFLRWVDGPEGEMDQNGQKIIRTAVEKVMSTIDATRIGRDGGIQISTFYEAVTTHLKGGFLAGHCVSLSLDIKWA